MNPDEYAAQQAAISYSILNYIRGLGRFFTIPKLSMTDWLNLLNAVFPQITAGRTASATLARAFYDSERAEAFPAALRLDRPLEGSTFETFVRDMEPTRARMQQPETPQDALTQFAVRSVREVENAGRQQIIHAVDNDPVMAPQSETRTLRGWARVATGSYTCAWCLMLVSRGPVYFGADTAGLDLNEEDATRLIAAGEDVSDYMQEWHTGCDCKAVPVFNYETWWGRPAAERALVLWNDATTEARKIQDEKPSVSPSGKNKGKEMTLNTEALNALRRRLTSGAASMNEAAALAA